MRKTITKKTKEPQYERLFAPETSETERMVRSVTSQMIATMENAFGEYGYYLQWLPNPDPVLKKIGKDIDAYEELLTDPFIKGVFESRKSGVLSKEWDIDRGKAKSRQAKAIKKMFENMNIYNFLNDILDAVYYGYQVFEYDWQMIDGMVYPKGIIAKPAKWFNFSPESKLQFKSKNNPLGEEVPPNKFLLVQHQSSYANPYGTPVASLLYWAGFFKKGGLKFWVKFVEKYGMPFLHGQYRQNSMTTEAAGNLVSDLVTMVQDGVIISPDNINFDLKLAAVSSSSDVFQTFMSYCKSEISIALLGHSGIAQETPGKLGNETAAIEVRGDIIASDKRMVEEVVNNIVQLIYKLNWGLATDYPTFILYEEEDVDMDLAQRDKVLYDTGLKFTKEYYKKAYGLDDEDFELSAETIPNSQPSADIAPKPTGKMPKATEIEDDVVDDLEDKTEGISEDGQQSTVSEKPKSFSINIPADQKLIDDEVIKMLSEFKPVMKNYLKPVESYVNGKSDFTTAISNIADLYPTFDTEQLEEEFRNRMFIANLIGRISVDSELKNE